MPNLQNLILTDRATTPVAHTFTPRGKEGSDGGRVVKSGVSAIGDLHFTITPRVTPGGRRKVDLALALPVVQTKVESGVTSYIVTRANRASMTFDLAPDTTDQEIKDLVGMMQSCLDPSKLLVNNVLILRENVF